MGDGRLASPDRAFASLVFFFNDTATTEIYTLSLHDALPICPAAPVTATRTGVLFMPNLLPIEMRPIVQSRMHPQAVRCAERSVMPSARPHAGPCSGSIAARCASDRVGLCRTTSDHVGPRRTTSDHVGPRRTSSIARLLYKT